jgi:hypothetical protein
MTTPPSPSPIDRSPSSSPFLFAVQTNASATSFFKLSVPASCDSSSSSCFFSFFSFPSFLWQVGLEEKGITPEKVFEALGTDPASGTLTKEQFVAVMNAQGGMDTDFRELINSTGGGVEKAKKKKKKKKDGEDGGDDSDGGGPPEGYEGSGFKVKFTVATKVLNKLQVIAMSLIALQNLPGESL